MFFGLAPVPSAIAVGVFALVVAATRMVSAGSILAAVAMAIAVFCFPLDPIIRGVAVKAVAALIISRHRDNIRRILRGQENRL